MFSRLEYNDPKNGINVVILTKGRCVALYTHHDGTFWRCLNIDERSYAPNKVEYPCADFSADYIERVRLLVWDILEAYERNDKLPVFLHRINMDNGKYITAEE